MAKKTAAQKNAAIAEMDSMFGIDIIPLGGTSLRVRRVLSRQQQRTVGDCIGNVQQISQDLRKLVADPKPDEDGNLPEPMTEEEMTAAAEALEESLHADFIRGIESYITNADELRLEEWASAGLSQLFTTLQRHSSSAVSKAVGMHFPTSGPNE